MGRKGGFDCLEDIASRHDIGSELCSALKSVPYFINVNVKKVWTVLGIVRFLLVGFERRWMSARMKKVGHVENVPKHTRKSQVDNATSCDLLRIQLIKFKVRLEWRKAHTCPRFGIDTVPYCTVEKHCCVIPIQEWNLIHSLSSSRSSHQLAHVKNERSQRQTSTSWAHSNELLAQSNSQQHNTNLPIRINSASYLVSNISFGMIVRYLWVGNYLLHTPTYLEYTYPVLIWNWMIF